MYSNSVKSHQIALKFPVCRACCMGRAHKLPFFDFTTIYNEPLQLIYSDIWGPSPIPSTNDSRYYIHFIDAYSKFTWLYLIHKKSRALNCFIHFKTMIENQLGTKIKSLQTDGGKEYVAFSQFLINTNGIVHRVSCPYTHEQNGSVERKHRHITEVGLTLLVNASVPLQFWGEAFQTATFLINRLPTPILDDVSALEKLFHKTPNYLDLKGVWLCLLPLSQTLQ